MNLIKVILECGSATRGPPRAAFSPLFATGEGNSLAHHQQRAPCGEWRHDQADGGAAADGGAGNQGQVENRVRDRARHRR